MFSPKRLRPNLNRVNNPSSLKKSETKIRLRWSYFVLPLAILLVSVIITIYFYANCPRKLSGSLIPPVPPQSAAVRLFCGQLSRRFF